ncbi:MAG: STAS-like domain-containing protein [Elusimicrobiota bacterium]|mgnify:CR=1 FL=1
MTSSDGIVTKFKIKDICGTNTVTRADGKKIHKILLDHWKKAYRIEVDFGNLEIASVSFLDEAIGQLALLFRKSELAAKLKLQHISSRDKRLLNDIFISRYRQMIKNKYIPRTH